MTRAIIITAGLFILAFAITAAEIHDAAKNGDWEKVKVLLAENPDLVNSRDDKFGATLLMLAVGNGHMGLVEFLLKNKSDVHATNDFGQTALHVAACMGNTEEAELLLASNADVNAKDTNAWTPLVWAVDKGCRDVAKLLLEHGADVHCRDINGRTPLHTAALQGHESLAELLLASKADVNARDGPLTGWTPLHMAAFNGHEDVAKLLIASKADVNARDMNNGNTPLHAAIIKCKIQEQFSPNIPAPSLRVVKVLLANKADLNAKNNEGDTPLHLAIRNHSGHVAELLRQYGAQDAIKDATIDIAVQEGDLERVKSLLRTSPELIFSRTKEGLTPLHFAAEKDMATLLLASGADVNAKDKHGRTPLHYAVGFEWLSDVAFRDGTVIHLKEKERFFMHFGEGNKDVVVLLLANKADVNARDIEGKTPLQYAASDSKDVQILLRQHGGHE